MLLRYLNLIVYHVIEVILILLFNHAIEVFKCHCYKFKLVSTSAVRQTAQVRNRAIETSM